MQIPAKFAAKLRGKSSFLIQERDSDRTKRHEILLRPQSLMHMADALGIIFQQTRNHSRPQSLLSSCPASSS